MQKLYTNVSVYNCLSPVSVMYVERNSSVIVIRNLQTNNARIAYGPFSMDNEYMKWALGEQIGS